LKPLAGQPGQQVLAFTGDVSRLETCTDIIAFARQHLDHLCILVNNAGITGPIGRFEECDWDEWVQAMSINLMGTALMTRAFLPIVRAHGYGKIINLSGGGATAGRPRFSAYASSKAAVVRLTESLAGELREDHIDVNAIAPGALNTRLLNDVLSAGPEKAGQDAYSRSLLQREQGGGSFETAGRLATFLASDESNGITGRLISAVWDDWEHLPQWRDELAKSDIFTLRRITPEDRGASKKCA
jgi:3-oxoacyl-[acyl-carrier protein] reductase